MDLSDRMLGKNTKPHTPEEESDLQRYYDYINKIHKGSVLVKIRRFLILYRVSRLTGKGLRQSLFAAYKVMRALNCSLF